MIRAELDDRRGGRGSGAFVGEEVAQQRGAVVLEHAAANLHPMGQPAVPQHIPERTGGSGFRLPAAEHQPGYPGRDDGPRAHGAGLNGDRDGAALEVPGAE